MTTRFERNARYFEFKNSRGSALLSCVDTRRYKLCKTQLQEPNLEIDGKCLHDQNGAFQEAQKWVDSLSLSEAEVVTIFGLGLGYSYYALRDWLDSGRNRQLIFLEDDLAVISCFLETELAEKLLKDCRVHLYFIEDSEEGLEVLKGISWAVFKKEMIIVAMPYYAKWRNNVFVEVKARLLYEASDIHAVLDEYLAYGVSYFRNFWRNLFLLPGSHLGNKLFGAFRGIPAIIVAAGPSLSSHFDQLKDLRDKALIFSGGSSTNALIDAGVLPHFGGGIDPNPLQYMRLRQGLAFQLPFFYRSRLLHEAANLITGPRLYLRGGDGYNISDYFERKAKMSGKVLGGGHSIANFEIEIAHALGCSPVILVGFDLAYGTNLERYARGVEENHPSNVRSDEKRQEEIIAWKDRLGKPIQTEWKWVLEGKWIEEFTGKHKRRTFINATDGGLGIDGIKHMSLEDAAKSYLQRSYDLDALVHTTVQEAGVCSITQSALLKSMAEMFDSITRSIASIDAILGYIQHGYQAGQKKKKGIHPLETADAVMQLSSLQSEKAFEYILDVFHRMRTKLDYYALQFAIHPDQKEEVRYQFELEMLERHYHFLKEVGIINQALIVQVVLAEQLKGVDITAFCPKTNEKWAEYVG
jgi:hypothetical protein